MEIKINCLRNGIEQGGVGRKRGGTVGTNIENFVLGDERMSEEYINEMIDDMRKNSVWMYNETIN